MPIARSFFFFFKVERDSIDTSEPRSSPFWYYVKPDEMPIFVGQETAQQKQSYGSTQYYDEYWTDFHSPMNTCLKQKVGGTWNP